MLLECELCGAHYKADIADAHVEGGRLTFTCKSCGREVVVIGGAGDRARRAGVLHPDQGDTPIEAPTGPRDGATLAAGPAGNVFPLEAAPEPVPSPGPAVVDSLPAVEAAVAAPERRPEPAPPETPPALAAEPAHVPEPVFAVEEKMGPRPLLLGIGLVAVLAVAFVLFIRPMLSRGPDGGPVEKSYRAAGTAAPPASIAPAAAAGTATPELMAPVPSSTPESAPVVQILELKPPEARPIVAPAPRRETFRDAATVLEAGAIEEALIRARPLYRLCAVTEVKRNPETNLGIVVASLTIAPSGTVSKVSLDRADFASSPLGLCVREALAKSTFPPFEGTPVVLRQPIDLNVPASR